MTNPPVAPRTFGLRGRPHPARGNVAGDPGVSLACPPGWETCATPFPLVYNRSGTRIPLRRCRRFTNTIRGTGDAPLGAGCSTAARSNSPAHLGLPDGNEYFLPQTVVGVSQARAHGLRTANRILLRKRGRPCGLASRARPSSLSSGMPVVLVQHVRDHTDATTNRITLFSIEKPDWPSPFPPWRAGRQLLLFATYDGRGS